MSQLDICRGDVVLVPFPYISDFTKAKTRPALVIQNDIGNRYGSTIILALISSSKPSQVYPMHYHIPKDSNMAKEAGLEIDSFVKAETIITLPKKAILKKVGHLPSQAMKEVNKALAISLDLKLAE